MPTTPTYPGVYIEEVPSGVHPITGVATSIVAFVDFFRRGPMNEAVQIFSFADFERVFGGLDARSESSYAIQQFFLNGGTQGWVIRVASAATTTLNGAIVAADTTITVQDTAAFAPSGTVLVEGELITYTGKTATTITGASRGQGGTTAVGHASGVTMSQAPARASVVARDLPMTGNALAVAAASEGAWGNSLRASVAYRDDPPTRFDLTISEVAARNGRTVVVRQEQYLDLSMNAADPRFVETVVNGDSELVRVDATGSNAPAASGTISGTPFAAVAAAAIGQSHRVRTTLSRNPDATAPAPAETNVDIDLGPAAIGTIDEAAARLESAIRNARPTDPVWAQATVRVAGGRLQAIAGPSVPAANFTFVNVGAGDTTAAALKLRTNENAVINVGQYQAGATAAGTGQASPVVGADGSPPNNIDLLGSGAVTPPTGLFALDKVDLFNILCLPRVARVDGTAVPFPASQVGPTLTTAIAYCASRRAFLIVDTPSNVNTVTEFKQWLTTTLDGLRDKNAAVYFPRTISPDPLNEFRPRTFGASGTVAGLYARTDAARGVWKAPAGTEAVLRNVQQLEYKLNDPENGVLNPLGINCLRTFDVYGNVCWGARTLEGADAQASEWKYVPVRRIALFLEESLYRGTKWVVFEPNDEPLWAQIRLNLGAFMHSLFRQGAFQGTTPREAYFVKCDKETTTQTDINNGVVNVLVGFAPLKPAEFVIIKIQQLAGQIET